MGKQLNVALIGNPNTGKTSVFNALTGLNQKVGNYPGITVDKKQGVCKLSRGVKANVLYFKNKPAKHGEKIMRITLNR